jgi:hypothetical protein
LCSTPKQTIGSFPSPDCFCYNHSEKMAQWQANPYRKSFHPRASFYQSIVALAQIRYISNCKATSTVNEAIKSKRRSELLRHHESSPYSHAYESSFHVERDCLYILGANICCLFIYSLSLSKRRFGTMILCL